MIHGRRGKDLDCRKSLVQSPPNIVRSFPYLYTPFDHTLHAPQDDGHDYYPHSDRIYQSLGPPALDSHLPGKTELHLIPKGPKAIAVLSIKLLIPALVGV